MSEPVIRHFFDQAEACRRMGSPFTAAVLLAVAEALRRHPPWSEAILSWPGDPAADALALRVAGALHRIVLDQSWLHRTDPALAIAYAKQKIDADLVDAALTRNAELLAMYLQSPPQTNDPQRSAVLLGGFLTAAALTQRPFALAEIGASAGLNQLWDSYGYDFGSWHWSAHPYPPLRLHAEWQGRPPPQPPVAIRSRAACDIAPIDARDKAQRRRLLSYIWADQPLRRHRVETALDYAVQRGVAVEAIAAGEFVARELARRPKDVAFLLYHSIVWQYIPAAEQRRIAALMAAAGALAVAAAPIVWLRLEQGAALDGAELTLTIWPGGETRLLAVGDYHGRWIRWLA